MPEVRTFGSGSTEAGSGSTEAVMSEKGNDGKFDAVTFYVEQRISIDEDDPLKSKSETYQSIWEQQFAKKAGHQRYSSSTIHVWKM